MIAIPGLVNESELFQSGFVVRNLDASMEQYGSLLGIRRWSIFTVDFSMAALRYRGQSSHHSFRSAMAMAGPMMIELLQPLEGRGTFKEFLDTRGEGLHHLGHVRVQDLENAVTAFEQRGFACVEQGAVPGQEWAYVDTSSALGYMLELCTGPDVRESLVAI